ncbi:MAG: 4Fe-4S dicluster domain-containing protein, partial [Calditrichota bacterium]
LLNAGHVPEGIDAGAIRAAIGPWTGRETERKLGLPICALEFLAAELWEHRGHGIIMAGEDPALQIAVNLINAICRNDGQTIDGTVSPSQQAQGSLADMLSLLADMNAGKVDVLIIWGSNPMFWLPESAGVETALKKVKTIVSLSDRVDETARYGHYVLPGLHYLESWGDAEPQVGLYSLTQPSIYPLYDNRAAEDSLLAFMKAAGIPNAFAGDWHAYLMDTWERRIYSRSIYPATFPQFWNSALRDGVLNTVEEKSVPRVFKPAALAELKVADSAPVELELVIYPSPLLRDGQGNNNAWLLECPDPVSRISWTNYAGLSPATAERLGLRDGDYVNIEANGVRAELPVQVQPGNCDNVIAVPAGWGRTAAGKIGNDVGVNALAFSKIESGKQKLSGIPCAISFTGKHDRMPCVQGHNYIEGRPIIAETSLEEYHVNHQAGHPHKHEVFSIWPEHPYEGNRWGMSIDLSSCVGCNACITACQVENNIPVVGKDEIIRGREMHWIRIDRYYSGEADNPEVTYQPMLCQHCENAPCETVCPVIATMHNEEGLNQQIYNRCVGTRYCSNNCPYKVRRFNWHEFSLTAYNEHPLQLVLNPEVTVREKGVMEKCTFCVQRIREGKDKAKQMGRPVRDDDIVTACQQTCPTDAITFGNINNPESHAAHAMKDERSYRVLDMLGVKPSIAYQTKIRNRPPRAGADHHDGEGHHA